MVAPLVTLINPAPTLGGGAFLPAVGAGIQLAAAAIYRSGGDALIPASAIWVFDATAADSFTCKIGLS